MLRLPLLAAALTLSACVASDPETVGGIIEMTDADYIAATGFTGAAIAMTSGRIHDDGTSTEAVQYQTDVATPEMLAAAPAALCGADGRSVLSSDIVSQTAEIDAEPGMLVLIAQCSARPSQE